MKYNRESRLLVSGHRVLTSQY